MKKSLAYILKNPPKIKLEKPIEIDSYLKVKSVYCEIIDFVKWEKQIKEEGLVRRGNRTSKKEK